LTCELRRPADGNSFAIGRLHENLPFFLRGRNGERGLKAIRPLRHRLVHVFQAVHVLLQPQDLLDHLGRLAKRLFQGEVLLPILQQVGEFACRQGQAGIDGRELDGLALALDVDVALQVDLPENRHVLALLGFVQPLESGPVGQLVLGAQSPLPSQSTSNCAAFCPARNKIFKLLASTLWIGVCSLTASATTVTISSTS
jgi:hypothetical protein